MQTVMLNSPRRLSLSTSNVGFVTITGSNSISFTNCTGELGVTEKGVNAGYPRFRDVSLDLNAEDKATGAATVTINAAGTAVSGVDYQLLTPSVTFAAGDNFKAVTLRIFDNPKVDNDRNIVVSYTISGPGVRPGANAQSVTITLLDDDAMRVGENAVKLLDEHFENPTGARGLPAGWGLLSTSGYANQFVASTNGDGGGSGLAAHITNDIIAKPNIYTKGVSGAVVLQSPIIDAGSVQSLGDLSFTYRIRGLADNDMASLTYTLPGASTGPFYYYGTTPGLTGYGPYSGATTITRAPVIAGPTSLQGRKFNLCFYWETGTLTTGVNPGLNVDDIVISATPFHVETAVSSSYRYDVQAGAIVNNFKSTNDKAVVTISNLSQGLTGVAAQVTQAGTGNTAFTTTAGSYLRTQKVFQVTPQTANTTASYQAKFYFTEAELAVWGANKLNLKIMKVKDGVALNSVLSLANTEIITPTVVEDTAAGYISYEGTFTGFSQFMLVSPLTALPVTVISFQATPQQKNILLNWTSAQEINNRGYYVDRSLDGVNYTQIGWVTGKGNSSVASKYLFTDNYVQPNITYYYRLRQVDMDNRQAYSPVRDARLKAGAGIVIKLSPNPAKDFVNLFISGTNSKATVEVTNTLGQKMMQQNDVNASNGVYKLPLQGLAKGVYNVVVYLPEGVYADKLIVE